MRFLSWLGSKTVIAAILYAASQIVTDHSPVSIATNLSILIGVIGARDAVRKVQGAMETASEARYAPRQTAGPTNEAASISPRRPSVPAPRQR